jgi:hypothetical protein
MGGTCGDSRFSIAEEIGGFLNIPVFLSFRIIILNYMIREREHFHLKREREHFPLFVPSRYCVPGRTFPGVFGRPALQAFTVSCHLNERSMRVFLPFVTFLKQEKF